MQNNRKYFNMGIILLVIIIAMVFNISKQSDEIEMSSSTEYLHITGPENYSIDILYSDIDSVVLVENTTFDKVITGFETANCRCGGWENSTIGAFSSACEKNIDHQIIVRTVDQIYIINYSSEDATTELYKALLSRIS